MRCECGHEKSDHEEDWCNGYVRVFEGYDDDDGEYWDEMNCDCREFEEDAFAW